jgi:hypothetical protein
MGKMKTKSFKKLLKRRAAMTTICLGNKKDGMRCSAHTSSANGYCHQHQGQFVPAPVATVAPASAPAAPVPAPALAATNHSPWPWIFGALLLALIIAGTVIGFKFLRPITINVPAQQQPVINITVIAPTQETETYVVPTPQANLALGVNGLTRRETGQGNTLAFNPGEMVYGWWIVLVDGRTCDGGNCFLTSAPVAGTVTSGVVNPWTTEIVGKTDSIFSIPVTPTPIIVYVVPTSAVPYNLPPQPQIGHPSLYLETGVPDPYGTSIDAHTKHWVIELLPDTTAIIGGFTVDGVSNGVYKAQAGPGKLDVTVTDGFVAIIKNEWANAEFCFRVSQAIQYNWAHQTELPLSGWICQ